MRLEHRPLVGRERPRSRTRRHRRRRLPRLGTAMPLPVEQRDGDAGLAPACPAAGSCATIRVRVRALRAAAAPVAGTRPIRARRPSAAFRAPPIDRHWSRRRAPRPSRAGRDHDVDRACPGDRRRRRPGPAGRSGPPSKSCRSVPAWREPRPRPASSQRGLSPASSVMPRRASGTATWRSARGDRQSVTVPPASTCSSRPRGPGRPRARLGHRPASTSRTSARPSRPERPRAALRAASYVLPVTLGTATSTVPPSSLVEAVREQVAARRRAGRRSGCRSGRPSHTLRPSPRAPRRRAAAPASATGREITCVASPRARRAAASPRRPDPS